MEQQYKVFILEDDVLIAESISIMLQNCGYDVVAVCNNFTEASNAITNVIFDIAILDINLGESKTGFDFAQEYLLSMKKPFLFLSAYSDQNTIKEAAELMPANYIVKPASSATLFAALQVAMYNFSNSHENTTTEIPKYFFVKVGNKDIKINWDEVEKLEHQKNYIRICSSKFTHSGYLIRTSLQNFIQNIIPKELNSKFIQINRRYVVRINGIDNISKEKLVFQGEEIEIGETFWPEIKKVFDL